MSCNNLEILTEIQKLRREYHEEICQNVIFVRKGVINLADRSSRSSRAIADELVNLIDLPVSPTDIKPQTAGTMFSNITEKFLNRSFTLLHHLRPGTWQFATEKKISDFEQYQHLAVLDKLIKSETELKITLGLDYIVTSDIVVARKNIASKDLNNSKMETDNPDVAPLSPLLQKT